MLKAKIVFTGIIALLPIISFAQKLIVDTASRPQVFAPGTVSSKFTEWATSFMPDGKTIYFSQGAVYWTAVFSKKINGSWCKPQVASFSGKWNDTDPVVSADGKRMIFVSNRPLPNAPQNKPGKLYHLWYADQTTGDNWGTPQEFKDGINSDSASNYGPSVSAKGTVYWCSRNRDGHKGMQSFYAVWKGDHYDTPRFISIKGVDEVQDPFIAPDESYLMFVSGTDMYFSARQADGWSAAQKLPANINNGDYNSSPCVSADGKTLYYSSSRIQGFYKRDYTKPALNYDELEKENDGLFNSQTNILMIPISLGKS